MIRFLARHCIRDYENVTNAAVRRAYGVLCGLVGIAINLLLFAGKLAAGLVSGSIAIMADAFNNLSDAGSSVVTLLGFKLAAQKPDKHHPFGHGRLEYISGLVVSLAILLMGVELLRSSVGKILHPEAVVFSPLVAAILLLSIGAKLYMAAYNRAVGKKICSAAMSATAADSLSDSMATGAVLLSTLAGHVWDLRIDGWCGVVVSLFIFWAGINAAKETISPLLGQPPSPEFVREVQDQVLTHQEITGIHDLIVHDYGPGRCIISLHAEVPADGDLVSLHDVVDTAERELQSSLGCLATIHMDPVVKNDGLTAETKERVAKMVKLIDPSLSIHDFRMVPGPTHTNLIFDALVPFDCKLDREDIRRRIETGVEALDKRFCAVVEIEDGYL